MNSSDYLTTSHSPENIVPNKSMSSKNIIIIFLIFILLICCCGLCISYEFDFAEMMSSIAGISISILSFLLICFIIYYYFYGDYKSSNTNLNQESFKDITKNMGAMVNQYSNKMTIPKLNQYSDMINQYGNKFKENYGQFSQLVNQRMNPQNLIPQNMIPQNMMPQNMMPQNMMPQNMMSQNLIPQNMIPQNMMPQNMIPQNMMPQNMSQQNMIPLVSSDMHN